MKIEKEDDIWKKNTASQTYSSKEINLKVNFEDDNETFQISSFFLSY